MALSAERLRPFQSRLSSSFSVGRLEEASMIGGLVLCEDANGTLQVC